MTDSRHARPVRSYVLREGRITKAQRRALDDSWKGFGVDYPGRRQLHLPALFGNQNPVYLEIGFGNGGSLLHCAQRHPERNYLGVEVHRPGVGQLLIKLGQTDLTNVRVLRHDALEVLRHNLEPACLQGVYLFFPDPWPKKRHHKRRFVQPESVVLLARLIRPGGFVHMTTDWQDYAEHMMATMSESPHFRNMAGAGGFFPRPDDRPFTKFELRGRRLGHDVWDLIFTRL